MGVFSACWRYTLKFTVTETLLLLEKKTYREQEINFSLSTFRTSTPPTDSTEWSKMWYIRNVCHLVDVLSNDQGLLDLSESLH